MTLRGIIGELPDELCRKSSVVVLHDLSVELLHPPNLKEELGEISLCFLEDSLLDAVAEFVVAVLFPEVVDGSEVGFRDELDLGEEDVATLLGGFACEDDEEAAGFLVGLAELFVGEVVLEDVEGDGLGGGGRGGGGGGGYRECGGGGNGVGERIGGGGGIEEERGGEGGGRRSVCDVALEEGVVVVEGLEGIGGGGHLLQRGM